MISKVLDFDYMKLKILISAGPTREMIDAVRFLSNRSTGKMGYALAQAAQEAGYETVLVSGPVALTPPAGVRTIQVISAAEMAEQVKRESRDAKVIIMAAAVADFRPLQTIEGKLKKHHGLSEIKLERTEDILQSLGDNKLPGQILVGFAAETANLDTYAQDKLERKNLDWIAANDVSKPGCGFGTETNSLLLLGRNGERIDLGFASKATLAAKLLQTITSTGGLNE